MRACLWAINKVQSARWFSENVVAATRSLANVVLADVVSVLVVAFSAANWSVT
jgi:hypothetical protein